MNFNQNQIPKPVLTVESGTTNTITMGSNGIDILKITEDGFFVRGQKVPVDENEGQAVYKAFRQFLVEHALTKNY